MKSRLSILTVILMLPLVVIVFAKSKPLNSPSQEVAVNTRVVNKTRSVEVVRARRDFDRITVVLKNGYDQRITAVVFSMGNLKITEDFIYSEVPDEFGIKPQETFEKTYPLPSFVQNNPSIGITIESVVLEDKSGDGDSHTFEEVRDERLGQAIQIKRSLKSMQRYLESDSGKLGMNVSSLRNNITAALDEPDSASLAISTELQPLRSPRRKETELLSDDVKRGLDAGKTKALQKIEEAEGSPTPREAVLLMKDRYEKLLAKL